MHERLYLFHLIDILRRLFLTNIVVRVVVSLLLLPLIGALQSHVDVPDHLIVLKLNVVLEGNGQAFVLKFKHQIVVGDQLG